MRLLYRIFLPLLCLAATVNMYGQTGRPKIQTSATSKETVYKPLSSKELKERNKLLGISFSKESSGAQSSSAARPGTTAASEAGVWFSNADNLYDLFREKSAFNRTLRQVQQNQKTQAGKADKASDWTGADRYLTIKTNVPMLALAVPNLAVEVGLSRHLSLDIPVMLSFWDYTDDHAIRTIAFQPELRYWIKEAGKGHFFGLHANVAWYNLKWDDTRYQTEQRPLLGTGLSYGYKLSISSHWGAEFTVGGGWANTKHNRYYNVDNGAQIDTRTCDYWGFTRAGISLIYSF